MTVFQRYLDLKQILENRRRELEVNIREKMKEVRSGGARSQTRQIVLDSAEFAEADIQEDIELTLVEMGSKTLIKINDALERLERGDYGNCFDCGEEIAEKRLRALPFAVRCKICEEAWELAEKREQEIRHRRLHPNENWLFFD